VAIRSFVDQSRQELIAALARPEFHWRGTSGTRLRS
jgi:hypothetical protein